MDLVKLLRERAPLDYGYDEEADILYLSLGKPAPATEVTLGPCSCCGSMKRPTQVVGMTVVALRRALEAESTEERKPVGVVR